jgi:hypothetical protein
MGWNMVFVPYPTVWFLLPAGDWNLKERVYNNQMTNQTSMSGNIFSCGTIPKALQ